LGSIDDPLLFFGAQLLGADDEDQSAGGLMTSSSDTDLAIKGITSASTINEARCNIEGSATHLWQN
jgi:hypothetical protein